jgi:serine/threonine protein kinase
MRQYLLADTTTGTDSVPGVSAQQLTIGMYHIEKAIGAGGMGTVYLGRHALLGRAAAIKVLRPSLSGNPEIVKRFFNEARALTRIADPGIVQVFDFGHLDDGLAFIVMEFLDGESLHMRLRRIRRFDAVSCLRLCRLICSSLAAVHAKGIVHRDLKPGNIFIVNDTSAPGGERTKIFDFGIAKQTGDAATTLQTRAGVLMGTPMYMSPEQCRGTGDVDHRSDIYSIACVMFTMLAGRSPFGRRAPGELVVAHLREPAPLASSLVAGVPAVVDDVLQRCLNKAPEERFQSMTELGHAIGAAEQLLTSATTPGCSSGPANVRTRSSSQPSLVGPIAASVLRAGIVAHELAPACRDGIAAPEGNHAGPGGPTTMRLQGTSGRYIAPGARGESSRRRWIAGAITVIASLLGVLCALVIAGNDDRDGAPPRETSTAQAAARPDPVPQRQPATVDRAVPAPPGGTRASGSAGPQDTDRSGAVAPAPPPRMPATAELYRARPRANAKRPSHPDTRGDHTNATRPAAPSNTEPQSDDSENVTRGD